MGLLFECVCSVKNLDLTKEHWILERKAQEVFVDPYAVELAKMVLISFEDI